MDQHKSTELSDLFKAMALAQSEINVAVRSSSNPFFKSSYANLQSIIEASRPSLCKNGLSVIQQMVTDNGQDYLVTMLCHSSGQWVSSQMRITPTKQDVQSLGSYITYLRRYCYSAIVGVYDGEDDDGEQSIQRPQQVISQLQATKINKLINNDQDILSAILKQYQANTIYDLCYTEADKVINLLEKKL